MKTSITQIKGLFNNIYSKKANDIIFVISLASLFTYGLMYRIIDCRNAFWILLPLTVYFIISNKNKIFPFDFSFLVIYVVFYIIAQYELIFNPWTNYIYTPIVYAWIAPVTYLFGKTITNCPKEKVDERAFLSIYVLSVGMDIQAILDNLCRFFKPLEVYEGYRWYSFWGRFNENRNTFDFGFLLLSASFFYLFINRKKMKRLFVFTIILEIISIILNIINQGRLNIYVFIGALIFSCILKITSRKDTIRFIKKYIKYVLWSICVIVFICLLFKFNIGGISDLYKASFWSRDGGLFHNIRLLWIEEGLRLMIANQKGGWALDTDKFGGWSTHNTWLEFGRNYDIIVFSIWMIFILYNIINGLKYVIKYGERHNILFYLYVGEVVLFIYCFLQPNAFAYMHFLLFYIFVCGLISGMEAILKENEIAAECVSANKYVFEYGNLAFCFLCMIMLSICYRDWWNDSLNALDKFIVPSIIFIIGSVLTNRKRLLMYITVSCVCMLYASTIIYKLYADGFLQGYSKNISIVVTNIFPILVLPISMIFGLLCYKLKLNKYLVALISIIISIVALKDIMWDGRIGAMREAIGLTFKTEFGQPWGIQYLKGFVNINNSYNVWLNYARDYGLFVFLLLAIFLIILFRKYLLILSGSSKCYIDYCILISFTMINIYFMFDETGYINKNVYYIGVGIFSLVSAYEGNEERGKKIICR